MSKVLALVFSKDRACQLDALLRSIDHFAPDIFDVKVLYTYSNSRFKDGYEQINSKSYNTTVGMHLEHSFREQTIRLTENSLSKCVCFFTDDTLLYSQVEDGDLQFLHKMQVSGADTFSLRNGINTVVQKHWEPIAYQQRLEATEFANFITWNFKCHSYETDYGRPVSLDGNMHPKSVLLESMKKNNWNCPRSLDSLNRDDFGDIIASYKHSVAVNIPVNLAYGGQADNWGHYCRFTLEDLNKRFIAGERIDFETMDFSKVLCSHQEIGYEFK